MRRFVRVHMIIQKVFSMRTRSDIATRLVLFLTMLAGSAVGAAESTGSTEKGKPLEVGSKPAIAKPADSISAKSKSSSKAAEVTAAGTSQTTTPSPALTSNAVSVASTPALPSPPSQAGTTANAPSQTPSGRIINDVRVSPGISGAQSGQTFSAQSSIPPPAADSLEERVRGLLQEKLGRDGEVVLRVSSDTPTGKAEGSVATKGKSFAPKTGMSPASIDQPKGQADQLKAAPGALSNEAPVAPNDANKPRLPSSDLANQFLAWDWSGHRGPNNWGRLDPSYEACSRGRLQSPPKIPEAAIIESKSPAPPQLSWVPQSFAWIRQGPLWTVNLTGGSKTDFRGESFALESIQFRFPGEPYVGDQAPDGSIHFIHRMGSRYLILAMPLEIGAEAVRNAILATLVRRFPFDASDSVKWHGWQIDWSDSLSTTLGSVLVFAGSLSHPPCTESVIWILSRKPLRLPEDQLLELTKLLGQGARATQQLNQRPVLGLSAKP